jgi:hypothetical protein
MKYLICTLFLLIGLSCAKIYYSPDAKSLANRHQKIALIPPKISITPRKKDNPVALEQQQNLESVNFQREMYSWLLKRKMQNKIKVDILDLETTTAKLTNMGYPGEKAMTPSELAENLGVDAVITSNFALSKPMSEGGAIALGILLGVWASTNEVVATVEIHDKNKEKLIWSFNHKMSGSTFSTPARLVDELMRRASKKMPYILEN